MAQSKVDILIDVQARLDALEQTRQGLGTLKQEAAGFGQQLRNALPVGLGVGGAAAAVSIVTGVVGALKEGIDTGIKYNAVLESQSMAFETLLGSASAAQQRVEELARFAAKTPFELPGVVTANRMLQTLTDGALAAENGMLLVGDAAAAANRPFEEVAFWVGRLYSGLQAGIPVGEATMRLSEMGLVSGELKRKLDSLADSKVVGGEAWAIAEKALSKYTGAMDKQSRTFSGQMSTLKDTLNSMAGEFAKPIFDVFKAALGETLVMLGAAPKPIDETTAAIERQTAAIERRSKTMLPKDVADVQATAEANVRAAEAELKAYEAAKAARLAAVPKTSLRSYWNSRLVEYSDPDPVAAANADSLTERLASAQASLVPFAGVSAVPGLLPVEEIDRRLSELEALSKQQVFQRRVPVRTPRGDYGAPVDVFGDRGLTDAETAERDKLTADRALAAMANTANATAKANEASAEAAAKAAAEQAKVNALLEEARKGSQGLKEKYQEITLANEMDAATLKQKLGLLDRELAAVEKKRQEQLAIAALAKDPADQKTAEAYANDLAAAKAAVLRGQRADVEKKLLADEVEMRGKNLKALRDTYAEVVKIGRARTEAALVERESDLASIDKAIDRANSREGDPAQRAQVLNTLYKEYQGVLTKIIALKKELLEYEDDPAARARTEAEIKALKGQGQYLGFGETRRGLAGLRDQHRQVFEDPQQITLGQGLEAGMLQWVNSVGTLGQQVANTFSGLISSSIQVVSSDILGLIDNTKSLGNVFADVGQLIIQTLVQMVVQALVFSAIMAILSAFGVPVGDGGFGDNFIQGLTRRERGGPVTAGTPYIVGEKRPELFVPSTSGYILPSLDRLSFRSSALDSGMGIIARERGAGYAPVDEKPRRTILVTDDMGRANRLRYDPGFETEVVRIMVNNRGQIIES